jgi:hypothetical protein
MRVQDVVVRCHRRVGGSGRIHVTASVAPLLPASAVPDGVELVPAGDGTGLEGKPGDVLVAATDDVATAGELVATVGADAAVVMVWTGPVELLPLGAVLDAVLAAGGQVVEAVPLEARGTSCAIVAVRAQGVLAPAPYLTEPPAGAANDSDDRDDSDDSAALRRIVAEWALGGLVQRALTRRSEEQLARLEAELRDAHAAAEASRAAAEASRAAAEASRARVDALERSDAMQLGRALARMRREPVRGGAGLTREVRRVLAARRQGGP